MPEKTMTVLVGVKVRGYDGPACFLVGHVMSGLRQVGIDCCEAFGIKDRLPEVRLLTEERNAAVAEVRRLQLGRSTAHSTEDVSAMDVCSECGGDLTTVGIYRKADGRGGMCHSHEEDCG